MLIIKQCPICAVRLKRKRIRSFDVDECETCGGLWLDAGELNGLSGSPMEARLNVGSVPTECRYCNSAILSGMSCVACNRPSIANCAVGHGPMKSAFVESGDKHVEVDICGLCSGIWLDGHERHLTRPQKWKPREKQLRPITQPTRKFDYWQDYDAGVARSTNIFDLIFDADPLDLPGLTVRHGPQSIVLVIIIIAAFYIFARYIVPVLIF